ncbi:MAG: TolC family protein [Eikenella sp.]|nr:TolC family protein [Eikenella sp.]
MTPASDNPTLCPMILRPYLLSFLLCVSATAAHADGGGLKAVLRHALNSDPRLQEARANVAAAEEQVKISQAGHYPVLSLTGRQTLAQHQNRSAGREDGAIGLHGRLNLYAWGGIEAAVDRDRSKQGYYRHKYDETREQLGKTIAELYLTALRAREQSEVYRESLARHDKMLHDLSVIVRYDAGRRSELTEAQARRLQAESNLLQQQRILHTSLSSLSRYTGRTLQAADLRDPFAGDTPENIISRYQNRNQLSHPSYLAQKSEWDSVRAQVDVSRARRLPSVNLEGNLNRNNREVFLSLAWNIFDNAARHTVRQDGYSLAAAEAKLDEILRETAEKSQTAQVDMAQSRRRMLVAIQQISAQREVVRAYEAQFKIARRSLADVLNAYQELSNIQIAEVNAYADFSDAALAYLTAQAAVTDWAHSANGEPGRAAPARPQQLLSAPPPAAPAAKAEAAPVPSPQPPPASPPAAHRLPESPPQTARQAKHPAPPPPQTPVRLPENPNRRPAAPAEHAHDPNLLKPVSASSGSIPADLMDMPIPEQLLPTPARQP